MSAAAPAFVDDWLTVYLGDCREVIPQLPEASVDCIVTSPPYWQQRSYLPSGSDARGHEIGREATFAEWTATIVTICTELRRVLKPTGSLWINVGDRYAAYGGPDGSRRNDWYVPRAKVRQEQRTTLQGFPEGVRRKSLLLAPYRLAIALGDAGWIVRDRIVWAKTNGMPESTRDRFHVRDEVLFRFTSALDATFDEEAVLEPYSATTLQRMATGRAPAFSGRKGAPEGVTSRTERTALTRTGKNPGNVWPLPTSARSGARFGHFAMMPPELAERPILATCPPGGVVLDPFAGTGTTAEVANRLRRRAVLIELDERQLDPIRMRTGRIPGAVAEFRREAAS